MLMRDLRNFGHQWNLPHNHSLVNNNSSMRRRSWRRYDRHWTRTHKNVWFFSGHDRYWQKQSEWCVNTWKVTRTSNRHLAHTPTDRVVPNDTWAKFIKQGFTRKSRQNILPVTQKTEGKAVSHVTTGGQVAVSAKCSRPSHSLKNIVVLLSSCKVFLSQSGFSAYLIASCQLNWSICGSEYEFFSVPWHENRLESSSIDFRRVSIFPVSFTIPKEDAWQDPFLNRTGLLQKSDDSLPSLQKNYWPSEQMVLQNAVRKELEFERYSSNFTVLSCCSAPLPLPLALLSLPFPFPFPLSYPFGHALQVHGLIFVWTSAHLGSHETHGVAAHHCVARAFLRVEKQVCAKFWNTHLLQKAHEGVVRKLFSLLSCHLDLCDRCIYTVHWREVSTFFSMFLDLLATWRSYLLVRFLQGSKAQHQRLLLSKPSPSTSSTWAAGSCALSSLTSWNDTVFVVVEFPTGQLPKATLHSWILAVCLQTCEISLHLL